MELSALAPLAIAGCIATLVFLVFARKTSGAARAVYTALGVVCFLATVAMISPPYGLG